MLKINADLSQVLDYWTQHKDKYAPSAYALLLCGGSELDHMAFDFTVQNGPLLDDMTGAYISLTLVAWQLGHEAEAASITDEYTGYLPYLHAAPSWALGSRGTYSLANALELPLHRLPLVLVSPDPWAREKVLVLSLRDAVSLDGPKAEWNEQILNVFAALFTACRATRNEPSGKRLALIRKHMRPNLPRSDHVILKTLTGSGIFAQLIEGIMKGLGMDQQH